jgi:outer membrane protein TolC
MKPNAIFAALLLFLPAIGLRAAPENSSAGNPVARDTTSARAESPLLRAQQFSSGEGNRNDPATAGSFRLADLVEEALRNNRDIRAAQRKYEASRQRPSQASTLPDPTLSFMSNNIGNPIPVTTLGEQDMSMAGFDLMQELPYPGKLLLKGRMAQKEADAEQHGYRGVELQVVSQVKQAFYRLRFVHQALDVLQKDRSLLDQFARIAEARYAVGKGIQPDVLRAQVELTALEKKRIELEQQKGSLEAQLASLLNRPPDSPFGLPADSPKAAFSVSLDELYQQGRTQAPALGQEQAMIEKNTYALDLARKDYYPDFAVGAGWFSRGGLRDLWSLRFDVKVPLYFWRKQRHAVAESAHSLEQSRREYEAATQTLHFRIKDDYLMARASEQLLDLYAQAIVPQATLALESAMASYQVGTLDFLSLLTNFQQLLEYELEYHREFAAFHAALARLEETTGSRLTE